MEYFEIDGYNREKVNSFIKSYWHTTEMIIRLETVDLMESDGIFASTDNEIVGIITYRIKDFVCEITSLASSVEGKGIGSELVGRAVKEAKERKCNKVILETTNDNINALRFYQKRGFDMVCLRRNSMDDVRKIKPDVPLLGKSGIPLRHNIEFEMCLDEAHV